MEDSIYIKRLKERLRQNHNSKVFLSFAEELRKKDRMDEAMAVLIDGIKRHPDFIAARLTLGRWYLFSGMFSEAQKEYLEVIKRSPGNVFAWKGLDETNRKLGIAVENLRQKAEDRSQRTDDRRQMTEDRSQESGVRSQKEAVIGQLSKFLEGVKIHFAYSKNLN